MKILLKNHFCFKQVFNQFSRLFHLETKSYQAQAKLKKSFNFHDYYDNKIFDLFINRHFLEYSSGGTFLGLLGKELKNNLYSEWRRYFLSAYQNLIEISQISSNYLDGSDFYNIVNGHFTHESFSLNNLPVLATTWNNHDHRNESLILLKFVKSTIAELELEKLHSDSLSWFKNYLRKPALVSASWEGGSDARRMISSHYNYEGKQITFQTSSLAPQAEVKQVLFTSGLEEEVSLVTVEWDLISLVGATLADAYRAIEFPNYHHTLLRIHPYLAPVKTSVTIEGDETEELLQLASELTEWLRKMGLSCWNAREMGLDFSDLDQCGVPYSLVVSDLTLMDGVLFMRGRDNGLKIEVHISEVCDKLSLYLLPRSTSPDNTR